MPESTIEAATQRMQATAEAIRLRDDDDPIPVSAVPELGDTAFRVRAGGVASPVELRDVRRVLALAKTLRQYAAAREALHPELARAIHSDASLDELLSALSRAIEDDGTISDAASPDLKQARARQSEVRTALVGKLGQLIRRYAEVLSGQYHAERDGRYVLPVRADAHLRVSGIVLGSSASGATLYVEPHEISELGNKLKMAQAAVEREEARVLTDLSRRVGGSAEHVEHAAEACARADVLAALARWAEETGSRAILPHAEPRFALRGFRHPLLSHSGAVVPNDLELSAPAALVISGPNAGGKTVALKCLGLAAWMVRCGVPLPVEPGSVAGFFDPVLADVGDDQSILRSLSTFSAHIVKLCAILEHAGPSALVLLDEVAAGTDPEEGSALAAALIEALLAQGAAIAVTTHYERMKELATDDPRLQNASVGLDPHTFGPTFKLTLGVPGPSSALYVAERFGVPKHIVDRARALLPQESIDRERLVAALNAERAALEAARAAAEGDARRSSELLAELEAEREVVRQREREKLAHEARELTTAVRNARAQLRELSSKLRRDQPSAEDLKRATDTVNEAARHIALDGAVTRATSTGPRGRPPSSDAELVPGARVYVAHLGAEGSVAEAPARGNVRVQIGGMRVSVPTSRVTIAAGKRGAAPGRKTRPAAAAIESNPVRTEATTLDLRGVRVEEARDMVDVFIDRLLGQGEPVGFVLHGHGTGALKAAVRDYLAASSHVAKSRPAERDEGGDAFTVFWVR
jgi:DNA mismatch repair protein MutS2